ncbi:helix-turn-helix domain-containing protein [Kitasatospora sp. NPDC001664]
MELSPAVRRVLVAEVDGIAMWDVRQPWGWPAGRWSPVGVEETDAVCLYRSGHRRRAAAGLEEYLDATTGYVSRRGTEERFAGAGEVETTVTRLTPQAYDEYLGSVSPAQGWVLRPDTAFDYRHRRLVADAARGADAFAVAEGLLLLLETLPGRTCRPDRSRPASWAHHRSLVMDAQEFLTVRPTAGLDDLARALATSPGHLSRVFRRVTGRPVTVYRNELRLRRALDLLARGVDDLGALAAELGFSDHAHLTRTVKRHIGRVPSIVRRELALAAPRAHPPGELPAVSVRG